LTLSLNEYKIVFFSSFSFFKIIYQGSLNEYNIDSLGFFLWIAVFLGFHWLFLFSLLSAQIGRIIHNKTTAESINAKINPHRYVYLAKFDRGMIANCGVFFGTPCRPETQDLEFGKTTADSF
jgi:hypothetical protein